MPTPYIRSAAAAVAVLLTFSAPVMAQSQPAAGRVHIDNFAEVNARYFRGAQPQGGDYADLASLGVKTVINLTSDDAEPNEQAQVEASGMKYVQIPMTTHAVPTQAQLQQFLSIADDPASQPVYVHCVGGRHRTGVMTAVYRMVNDGISGADAFKEMKQFKYGMDFLHPEFKSFVQAFDAKAFAAASAAGSKTGR